VPLWNDRPEAWHEVLPGVKRRILTHGPELMLVLYEIAPNTRFPMHSHPHVQAGTFLEGGGQFRVGDETWAMVKGSAYHIPGGVPHELLTHSVGRSVILDVFSPTRDDLLPEAVAPDRP
jgi:quercetin dioxygenase-like cupin family protein